jgi:dipeptidyl aminopeptidase/acylaminoacyl peptidase
MRVWAAVLGLSLACCTFAGADGASLLPRGQLSGPERFNGAISPDGQWLAYIGLEQGVPNVFVAKRQTPHDARALTHDRGRGIRQFWFAYDNRHVLYGQDENGDENDRIYAADLTQNTISALTPKGVRAVVDMLSPEVPGAVLIMMNDRDKAFFDPVLLDIASGRAQRLHENASFAAFVADRTLRLRLATQYAADGAKMWSKRDGTGWRIWGTAPPVDALTSTILGFADDADTLYLADSRGRDTAAIVAVQMRSGQRTIIAEDPKTDLGVVATDPKTGRVQAAMRNALRPEWIVTDAAVAADFEALRAAAFGEPVFVDSRSLDDRTWIVRIAPSNATARTYIFDRPSRRLTLWFEANPAWANLALRPLHAAAFQSRDGLPLTAYYMAPAAADREGDGVPDTPSPGIIWVHGGPWDREEYGLKPLFQLYANRGYAVLSVNFRGSTGFGKRFVNAGNGEWGGRMQDDLLDAKAWATKTGLFAPRQVAIMGGSYGGYAALAGMAFTPGAFKCGVSVAGPSNLLTLMSTIPEYWTATRVLYETRVGDPRTERGRALLQSRSPLRAAGRITGALLIGQGANDPRVTRSEAEQMVTALQERKAPVVYALFPDEGHGFQREENDRAFSAVTEEFLARCLGGRFEPVGQDFVGSSITLPASADFLPGVASALARTKSPATR